MSLIARLELARHPVITDYITPPPEATPARTVTDLVLESRLPSLKAASSNFRSEFTFSREDNWEINWKCGI